MSYETVAIVFVSLNDNICPYQGTYPCGRDIHGEEMENSCEDIKFGKLGLCLGRVGLGGVVGKAYRAFLKLESLGGHIGC